MSDIVTIDIDCGIADVRLNRPEKYNALSGDMSSSIQWIIVPCESSCNLSNIERALQ